VDESAIIREIQKGDVSGFDELMAIHQAPLLRMAYAILRNQEDADDAVQEAFVRAFFSIRSFQFRSSFRTWLVSIMLNQARNILKRRKRNPVLGVKELANVPDKRCDGKDSDKDITGLYEAIRQETLALPDGQRVALMLRVVEGKSLAEIAASMGISEGTVKSHLHRAFTWIRRRLGKDFKEVFDGFSG
jgi:RNA polymerase sigma-70 factor (ECF subfamily)